MNHIFPYAYLNLREWFIGENQNPKNSGDNSTLPELSLCIDNPDIPIFGFGLLALSNYMRLPLNNLFQPVLIGSSLLGYVGGCVLSSYYTSSPLIRQLERSGYNKFVSYGCGFTATQVGGMMSAVLGLGSGLMLYGYAKLMSNFSGSKVYLFHGLYFSILVLNILLSRNINRNRTIRDAADDILRHNIKNDNDIEQ